MRRDIHAVSGTRTHNPSVWVGEGMLCLRLRCHCGRLLLIILSTFLFSSSLCKIPSKTRLASHHNLWFCCPSFSVYLFRFCHSISLPNSVTALYGAPNIWVLYLSINNHSLFTENLHKTRINFISVMNSFFLTILLMASNTFLASFFYNKCISLFWFLLLLFAFLYFLHFFSTSAFPVLHIALVNNLLFKFPQSPFHFPLYFYTFFVELLLLLSALFLRISYFYPDLYALIHNVFASIINLTI